jgi:hypothetical protein
MVDISKRRNDRWRIMKAIFDATQGSHSRDAGPADLAHLKLSRGELADGLNYLANERLIKISDVGGPDMSTGEYRASPCYWMTHTGIKEMEKSFDGEPTRHLPSQVQAFRPKIFLCYRREDTQGFARGIYESLASKYGHEQVFRDIDSTPAGVKYSIWIESRVGQCSVMIVLIGGTWLSAKDRAGQRRLDLPEDWVRQEIEAALKRDIPIIPVRVQGAPMPSDDELPPSIADLTGFQSAEITDSRWAFDVGLLIQAIDNLIAEAEPFTEGGLQQ